MNLLKVFSKCKSLILCRDSLGFRCVSDPWWADYYQKHQTLKKHPMHKFTNLISMTYVIFYYNIHPVKFICDLTLYGKNEFMESLLEMFALDAMTNQSAMCIVSRHRSVNNKTFVRHSWLNQSSDLENIANK